MPASTSTIPASRSKDSTAFSGRVSRSTPPLQNCCPPIACRPPAIATGKSLSEVQVAMLSKVRKVSSDRRLARELLDLSASWTGQQVPLLPEREAEDVGVEHVIGLKDLRLR